MCHHIGSDGLIITTRNADIGDVEAGNVIRGQNRNIFFAYTVAGD